MSAYIGIDPGNSGSIAVVENSSQWFIKLDSTEKDIYEFLRDNDFARFAMIEKVSSSPQMGVTSSFTFGRSYGFLIGILTACCIPYDFVTPQKWQKTIGCMTGGDKNVSKAAAQRLFPAMKITHANADSLLIAEYCRRNFES